MFTKENPPKGGRPLGAQNKSHVKIKEAYQKLLEDNLDSMNEWLAKIATKDPARAIDLMLRLSEYLIPKLARTEVTGNDGEGLFKGVKFTFSTANDNNEQNGQIEESTQPEDPTT